jgi:hypothetical protein
VIKPLLDSDLIEMTKDALKVALYQEGRHDFDKEIAQMRDINQDDVADFHAFDKFNVEHDQYYDYGAGNSSAESENAEGDEHIERSEEYSLPSLTFAFTQHDALTNLYAGLEKLSSNDKNSLSKLKNIITDTLINENLDYIVRSELLDIASDEQFTVDEANLLDYVKERIFALHKRSKMLDTANMLSIEYASRDIDSIKPVPAVLMPMFKAQGENGILQYTVGELENGTIESAMFQILAMHMMMRVQYGTL